MAVRFGQAHEVLPRSTDLGPQRCKRERLGGRLHVVTGRGGTGKTTAPASLAITLAARGRTLLVEVDEREGLAQLFDLPPLLCEERKLTVAPGDGGVYGLADDAHEAMHEYLEMYFHFGRTGALR